MWQRLESFLFLIRGWERKETFSKADRWEWLNSGLPFGLFWNYSSEKNGQFFGLFWRNDEQDLQNFMKSYKMWVVFKKFSSKNDLSYPFPFLRMWSFSKFSLSNFAFLAPSSSDWIATASFQPINWDEKCLLSEIEITEKCNKQLYSRWQFSS